MKRYVSAVLAFLFAVCLLPAKGTATEFNPASISTPYVCLMDASTGAVLYEKNAYTKAYPASTTKIMTCILAIEMCESLNEIVTVGDSVETRGSLVNIVRREQMPLIDMIYGMMLRSGNDAARAIAEHFAGSESAFAQLMNDKAAALGMTGTTFVKSNGLHADDHYTTAYDMALLSRYCMQNETFRTIVSTTEYHAAPTNKDSKGYDWTNTNRLLYTPENKNNLTYRYATGIKTGDTAQAGRCLVASAEKDGVELVLVLFGDYENKVSSDYRFENAAKIFEWAFSNYASISVSTLGLESTIQLSVTGTDVSTDAEGGKLTLNINLTGLKTSGTKETIAAVQADPGSITSSYVLDRNLAAPIYEGEIVGTMYYKFDGNPLFEAELIASRNVLEAGSIPTSVTFNPEATPLSFVDMSGNGTGNYAWVFWALAALVLLVAILALRGAVTRRTRRRRSPKGRRRSSYKVYKR